ncbi:MAG: SDR family NAD(P)-dependent oxidoreductase [Rhodobacter sp.]|nr:SDR family NAD(P)-dependent oxidoreductase [Rhodobacter sp.]
MRSSASEFNQKYGPWALVTGASDGIGAAIAGELGARGLNLILVARSMDRLEALAESVRKAHGVEATAVAADLGREADLQSVLDVVGDKEAGLYAGCAGFGTAGKFADNSMSDELNMIDVNCRALAALAHPLATRMRARGRGGIILMSSIVAFQGVSNSANYAATKAFVQTLAEGLHDELSPDGVDVLASAPGPVATGFATRADMNMGGAAKAHDVAISTLAALGRSRTVRPGFKSKLLGYGLATLPRALRSRILGGIMMGMTKHRHA